jgi:hypothetical protein
MSAADLQQWILVLSGSVTMVSVAVGIWLSLREYRLKLQAETRQKANAEVEADIRLNTLFLELMKVANGRSGYSVSEGAVDYVLKHLDEADLFTREDSTISIKLDQVRAMNEVLRSLAIVTLPVGSAEQDASVAAIASLAKTYERLRPAALCALEGLQEPFTTKVAKTYLEQVRRLVAEEDRVVTNGHSSTLQASAPARQQL